MNGWFIAMICTYALNVGINLAKHGETRKDKYNFISSIIGATIGIILLVMAIKTGF